MCLYLITSLSFPHRAEGEGAPGGRACCLDARCFPLVAKLDMGLRRGQFLCSLRSQHSTWDDDLDCSFDPQVSGTPLRCCVPITPYHGSVMALDHDSLSWLRHGCV